MYFKEHFLQIVFISLCQNPSLSRQDEQKEKY